MAKVEDIVPGARFGRLVILSSERKPYTRKDGKLRSRAYAIADCDCGTKAKSIAVSAIGKLVTSCGCLRLERLREKLVTHGMRDTPTYVAWCAMKQRIFYEKHEFFHIYGGRGVGISESFLGEDGFKNFINEVGEKPSKYHSLDRIDVEKGYEPGNLRWATAREQARNKRNTLWVSHNGKKISLPDACELANIKYQLVYDRIQILGWSPAKALMNDNFSTWS